MGKIFICKYLPGHLIPEKFDELEFDEFFKLIAMAEISGNDDQGFGRGC